MTNLKYVYDGHSGVGTPICLIVTDFPLMLFFQSFWFCLTTIFQFLATTSAYSYNSYMLQSVIHLFLLLKLVTTQMPSVLRGRY